MKPWLFTLLLILCLVGCATPNGSVPTDADAGNPGGDIARMTRERSSPESARARPFSAGPRAPWRVPSSVP
jgi:hypothetical protein